MFLFVQISDDEFGLIPIITFDFEVFLLLLPVYDKLILLHGLFVFKVSETDCQDDLVLIFIVFVAMVFKQLHHNQILVIWTEKDVRESVLERSFLNVFELHGVIKMHVELVECQELALDELFDYGSFDPRFIVEVHKYLDCA